MAHHGKTVLVTGAGGGLGRAIAEHFLEVGANIVICEINSARLADFQEKVAAASPDRVLAIECDITSDVALDSLFAQAQQKFGHFDYVVNSAGILDDFAPIGDVDMALWDKVMAVNLTAPANITKRAVNMFLENDVKGVIININSLAGLRGFTAGAAYTTSKHALIGLTKNTAAFYHSKGIRANAIAAGAMQTNIADAMADGYHEAGFAYRESAYAHAASKLQGLVPLPKMAKLVAYLCSDDADMITGAVYTVDDGITAS